MRLRAILIALLVFLSFSLPGCREAQRKMGIGVVIENPDPAGPEAVVQNVLRSALAKEEEAGWQEFAKLLHSDEANSPRALQYWREYKYRGIRKVAPFLVEDRASVKFRELDLISEGNTLIVKVKSSNSDTLASCRLRRDATARDQWRVFGYCF